MTTPTLTLSDFLHARLDERKQADDERLMSGTTAAALNDLAIALRRVGADLPFVQREMARRYADHADFRDDWRI